MASNQTTAAVDPSGEETWQRLEAGVDHIFNHLNEGLLFPRYMALYKYNFFLRCDLSLMEPLLIEESTTIAQPSKATHP